MQNQSGQTLIETLVAAFILVMGISAALGLAIYSLGATSGIRQQTIAIGLAREGVEIVKNIRDTNWLKGTLSTNCWDFGSVPPGGSEALCYLDWLDPDSGDGQDISAPGMKRTFSLKFDDTQENPWVLSPTSDFGLNSSNFAQASEDFAGVFYTAADGISALEGNSGFARAITITEYTGEPFDKNTGPRLKVTSQVWWSDKNCPMTIDPPASTRCMVTVETYLTNWRNF